MSTVLGFHGAAGTVTGSKFLLEHDGASVLVDCGLFQGLKDLRLRNWDPLGIPTPDAVVLSHAHLDHCGYLPRLVRDGFAGTVYASESTVDLARIVLSDSAHLQEEEANYANRAGYSRHHPALPLYTVEDADRASQRLQATALGHEVSVAGGLDVTLEPAGHILGSCVVRMRTPSTSVIFSGDLGRSSHPLLRPPAPIGDVEWIVVESTYGDRLHSVEDPATRLGEVIARTVERGGTVIIPAFAVDRTEVILHHLGHLDDRGQLPPVPVYVDSPMALAALGVYRRAIERRDPQLRPEVLKDPTPFLDHRITEVHDPMSSKAVTASDEPKIIISASGMASGGRVVHHLARYLPDPASSVVLAGFQAVGTRGRSLLEGASEIKMMGRYVRVRAEIADLGGLSVHADVDDLMAWLSTASTSPRGVFCVHGEPAASRALAARIRDELDWTAVVPRHGEQVML